MGEEVEEEATCPEINKQTTPINSHASSCYALKYQFLGKKKNAHSNTTERENIVKIHYDSDTMLYS